MTTCCVLEGESFGKLLGKGRGKREEGRGEDNLVEGQLLLILEVFDSLA